MITQNTIGQIMAIAKVEDIVGDFVNLKRRGVNLIGLCPFHDEKTPSFTVSPAKNIYKCFGCGKGGDAVRFVMDHEGFSYPEALKYVARKYNIEVEETEDSKEELLVKEVRESLYIINELALEYFKKNLLETTEGVNIGKSYFKERGFTEATIKKFNLGYASGDYNDFYEYAKRKKINLEHAKSLGLISTNNNDFFRSRVMFTIHNLSGKPIAFAGRTMTTSKKTPKYINSPESEIYNKRNVLYAMHFAKTPIRKEDECYIVEGYTDVITLHQNGIENVVASSGTSLTEGQIRLVKRYTENITIIYDGDPAGIKAALRGLDLVLGQGMNVKLVLLPEGQDPDSYLKAVGVDSFKTYLAEHAQDFVIFKTNLLLKETGNDPIKRSEVLNDIVASIAKIRDLIKRSIYIKECSNLLEIGEEVITRAVSSKIKDDIKQRRQQEKFEEIRNAREQVDTRSTDSSDQGTETVNISARPGKDYYQERDVLRVLLKYGNETFDEFTVAGFIFANIEEFLDLIVNPTFEEIFKSIKEQFDETGQVDVNSFTTSEHENIRNIVIELLSDRYEYANWESRGVYLQNQKDPDLNYQKDASEATLRFLVRKVNTKKSEIEAKLKELAKDSSQETDFSLYLKVLQKLTDQRNALAEKLGTVSL